MKQKRKVRSGNTTNVSINKRFEELTLSNKPKLIVSKELKRQIDYLHDKVGNDEWSGALYYRIIEGSVADLSTMVVKAELVYLMDIGTSTYTEYEFDEKITDLYEKHPEVMEMKMGHIHTHHNMSTFFSGVDTQELHDNAPNYNYYLSLIVNFKEEYCAKLAFISKYKSHVAKQSTITMKDADGEDLVLPLINGDENVDKEVLCMVDFDITIEEENDDLNSKIQLLESNIDYTSNKVFTDLVNYVKELGFDDSVKTDLAGKITKVIEDNIDIDTVNLRVDSDTKERYIAIKEEKEKKRYTNYTPSSNYNNNSNYGKSTQTKMGFDYGGWESYYDDEPYYTKYYGPSNYNNKPNSGSRPTRNIGDDTEKGIKLKPYELENYLVKLINLDVLNETSIGVALKELNKETMGVDSKFVIEQYKSNVRSMYHTVFTVNPDDDDVEQLAIDAISLLSKWEVQYSVASDLIDMFNTFIPGGKLKNIEKNKNIITEEKMSKKEIKLWNKLKQSLK